MAAYSVREAKNRLSALLAQVRRGARVVITHRGVPVAALVRPEEAGGAELAGGRLAGLVRAGLITQRRKAPSRALIRAGPVVPSKPASAVDALLAERAEGR